MHFDGRPSRDRGRWRPSLKGLPKIKCPFCGRTTVVTKRGNLNAHGGQLRSCPGSCMPVAAL